MRPNSPCWAPAALGLLLLPLASLAAGCSERRVCTSGRGCDEGGSSSGPAPGSWAWKTYRYPQSLAVDYDILFVIDNSSSMEKEQKNLAAQFPKLIEALRSKKLGNKIPSVHIGAVSTDLGTAPYAIPGCDTHGGDRGVMQTRARRPGCPVPSGRFIRYVDGKTNIPGCTDDPIACVKRAFSCIAPLGTRGCGFEMPLEAARQALDPKLARNPGFVRRDALLVVVFLTDEDDCSARDTGLFDPSHQSLDDPLGPLTSFRCFEFGVACDGPPKRTDQGERKNCRPDGRWMYPIQAYVDFFAKLKGGDKSRVLVAAIAGPTSPVRVTRASNQTPTLAPSCQNSVGNAVPAIRLGALVDALDGQFATICTDDYGPALALIGDKIPSDGWPSCLPRPLLLADGGLACQRGVTLPGGLRCGDSCLERVDCTVEQGPRGGPMKAVERCPAALFGDPKRRRCGDACPCWRIAANRYCEQLHRSVSPFSLEILGDGDPPSGTIATLRCRTSTYDWGSKELAALPRCR